MLSRNQLCTRALEQRQLSQRFEPAELSADGGLRGMQKFSGTRRAAGRHYRPKYFHMAKTEIHEPTRDESNKPYHIRNE
jgi:hypothetical protein